MGKVFLSLGSSVGDRAKMLKFAILKLKNFGKIRRKSCIYETQPWDSEGQPWFLNQVIEMETRLYAEDLLQITQEIERELGRSEKTIDDKHLPRETDIDILFYDGLILKTANLEIPHPRIASRRFVLRPFVEIAPDFIHPLRGKTIKSLLNECSDASIVRPLKNP